MNPRDSTAKAIIILALGLLNLDNGFPGFRISIKYKYSKLQSGNIMGALNNTP